LSSARGFILLRIHPAERTGRLALGTAIVTS
jgi:hypothetical protein